MQANHPSVQGKRLFPAMVSIAKKEGIRGLWSVSEDNFDDDLSWFVIRVSCQQFNEQPLLVEWN